LLYRGLDRSYRIRLGCCKKNERLIINQAFYIKPNVVS